MMRTIKDTNGQRWDVSVGRESYGMLVLLFSSGTGVRKALMSASTQLEAQHELEAMSETQLCERLAESQPWEQQGW
jgi:hypothetical protein